MTTRTILAGLCLAATTACSGPGEATARDKEAAAPVAAAPAAATPAAPAVKPAPPAEAGSRVIGKKDFALRGKPACQVDFVYAGRDPENLFWEEPCQAVTARMMGQGELESLGKWERLDEFERKFVAALPGGKVLYIEGSFSASIYPVGTTGETYEVPVAD